MKKLVALVFCAVFAAAGLTGCSANEEPYIEKTYTPENAQINAVCIDVRDRTVEVVPSEDEGIHLVYFESETEAYSIAVSGDNVLAMTAENNKKWTDSIGGQAPAEYRKITVRLPDSLLDSLSVSTTNEDIAVGELAVNESISLKANGGNISFLMLSAGNEIALDVKNGNITGAVSGSYDDYAISCTVKKGECNLPASKENGEKKLTVAANNGDVTIQAA